MKKNEDELKKFATLIRRDIIKMLFKAGSGHSAGALGLADIFSVLYSNYLKYDVKNPNWNERDFVFLSNGHTCPVLYSTLSRVGFFDVKELETLRKLGSRLQGHPHFGLLPGVENSGGPLGQGISQAVGLSASLKRDNKKNKVYCFIGDGEIEEGQCWEALMFAAKEKLNNLVLIIDRNHIQIDGSTDEVMHLEPLHKKISAFNWTVIDFNGNDIKQIISVFNIISNLSEKPICLIAKTVPGKGVSFVENNYLWHGKVPNKEETKKALGELY